MNNIIGLPVFVCIAINFCASSVLADQPANNSSTSSTPPYEEKRFNFPFVHIDVKKHADGTKDVDVRAPFTKVHNPAGASNAQVSAPFYKQGDPSKEGSIQNKAPNKSKTASKNKTASSSKAAPAQTQ